MAEACSQPLASTACGRRGPPRQTKQSRHALGGASQPLLPVHWASSCTAAACPWRLRGRPQHLADLYRQQRSVYTRQP